MFKKQQFTLTATLLAVFLSPQIYAIEDCGTSVTECKLWQAIKVLQKQTTKLAKENQALRQKTNASNTLVITDKSCSNKKWYAEVETPFVNNRGGSGSIFLDIRANFTHCGGGCHWAFRHLEVLFNAYTSQKILTDTNNNGNGAGEWTISRLITYTDKHGGHSTKMRIEKSAGSAPYCGPVDIRIEANTPIRLLKTS